MSETMEDARDAGWADIRARILPDLEGRPLRDAQFAFTMGFYRGIGYQLRKETDEREAKRKAETERRNTDTGGAK